MQLYEFCGACCLHWACSSFVREIYLSPIIMFDYFLIHSSQQCSCAGVCPYLCTALFNVSSRDLAQGKPPQGGGALFGAVPLPCRQGLIGTPQRQIPFFTSYTPISKIINTLEFEYLTKPEVSIIYMSVPNKHATQEH